MGTEVGAGEEGTIWRRYWQKKCSGKLYEVTERLRRPVFEEEKVDSNEHGGDLSFFWYACKECVIIN